MATSNPIIVEKDIYDLLNDGGYFDDWSAYYGLMPDSNDNLENDVICINASSGLGVDTNQFQRPNFQILVRSSDFYDGRVKSQELLEYLMNFSECLQLSVTINGHHYPLMFPWQTAPEHLGYDEKHRSLFSMNFNAFAEQSILSVKGTNGDVLFDTTNDVLYGTAGEVVDG